MPTYQVTYEAEEMTTTRNYYAQCCSELIDKVIDQEAEDWAGCTVKLEIARLGF